ncbi:inhibitor of nuclear factor kappa-B kinase subunit epsilon-like isoform X2 [Mizuhopecten yessoensis]|uniref:inhibitor of nuclear factor kappa-B kinase subunit epsilon-like isoform X2 n=1 Tax=Mizuhopecten yessoensis TaxID=6573 RepID=UPI000B45F4E6|nr:inhibitor of nuclear factor kappa-B kinase subunit epsilon-like isoform X2 [Mizuhopecten yessoensis]
MKETDNHEYRTQDLLGSGATADVYKGTNKNTGEVVALKMINISYDSNIQREMEALKKLQHPNIVRFFNCEKDSLTGRFVLVMELCEKGSLQDLLEEPENYSGMDEDEFLRFFEHLVNGTKHMRNQGFSHRDIKPRNVLVFTDEDGSNVYKLSDFGTAKPLGDEDLFMSLVGTEEYLHPAMYRKAFIDNSYCQVFDISADIWSLGVTLYHAATGQTPFNAYGGRSDKAKTYEIYSNKAQGVISGQQEVSEGPIVWSRDLPNTCKLSRPLKDRIRDILVRIFDSATYTPFGFDDFFDAADTLIGPCVNHLHVFYSLYDQHYRLFLDTRHQTLSEVIQQIIGKAYDEQVILCKNGDIVGTKMQNTPICRYSHTSRADPLILMSTNIEEIYIEGLDGVIDKPCAAFPAVVDTDHAYKLAKSMCEDIHLSRKKVHTAVLSQKLFTRIIARHGSMLDLKIRQHRRDFDLLRKRFDDVTMKINAQRIANEFQVFCYTNIRNKLHTCGKSLKNVGDEYDAAMEAWNISDSAVRQNQSWKGKADQIVELSKAQLQKLGNYRRKDNQMTLNEEKMFALDREAMEDLNKEALLEDFWQSHAKTRLKFIEWYRRYTGFSQSVKDLGRYLEDLQSSNWNLVDNVNLISPRTLAPVPMALLPGFCTSYPILTKSPINLP